MGWAVAGLVVVIVGVSAIETGGLSWTGFAGALAVALYASVVVVAAIAFQATYRRHNPHPPRYLTRIHRHAAAVPAVAPENGEERTEEPLEEPVPPQPEEHPAP